MFQLRQTDLSIVTHVISRDIVESFPRIDSTVSLHAAEAGGCNVLKSGPLTATAFPKVQEAQ